MLQNGNDRSGRFYRYGKDGHKYRYQSGHDTGRKIARLLALRHTFKNDDEFYAQFTKEILS